MRKKIISLSILCRLLSPLVLGVTLSGCIGSQFVVDDADDEVTFPSLHNVPERPDLPDRSAYTEVKDGLSLSQQETLDENAQLRKEHGL